MSTLRRRWQVQHLWQALQGGPFQSEAGRRGRREEEALLRKTAGMGPTTVTLHGMPAVRDITASK